MGSVLIFGGSGFIGTHYSKKLISEGYKIYIVDLKEPRFKDKNLFYINCDVRDLSSLKLECKINRIYNFAAIHTTPGHPTHEYYETNIAGANEVCSFAEKNKINEIIFTSSISVYGPDEEQKDEYSTLSPNSAYGYSKMLAENIHKAWNNRNQNSLLTIIRPAVVFGPGEGGNFTRLANLMQKGVFIYPGRKDTIKSCIYVDDLIYLIEKARNTESEYELLNGCYPERYTLEDIILAFKLNHYPDVMLFSSPKFFVLFAAKVFKIFNFLNIGVHPDRVMKLIKSTNIYPTWLVKHEIELPGDLKGALKKWAENTNGRFN
ncbi:NAD(P)-dependent oxidoreductase [Amphritea sp. 1_MG-2023]|uniref:NAD-dependent epimerase/dehydratase family protein n=1 Tax=Amphritea sp. 1_MG-2023 TaxID=3062670 RepID=UPI0026E4634B|nr:NAD(P)-dependent oxidoreductase [Amphritea sp. 1_MG-2023]MDO6565146.1 NAD(P)-dependent oxidoreductase [Amphritea sp. 1_MG-2023]